MLGQRTPLFVYGTLLDPITMLAVTGRSHHSKPALLYGYRRYRLRHRGYPGIVPEPGACVQGEVYDLDHKARQAVDRYEDRCYERVEVTVQVGGSVIQASTYVIADHYRHLIDPRPWDPAVWRRRGSR